MLFLKYLLMTLGIGMILVVSKRDLPEAIRAAQRALSVAADAGNRQLAGVLKQRLALYESEIPVQ